MMKKIIDIFGWVLFFSIFLLTTVVYISQNSIPGDTTFPVKLGFEKVLVRTSGLLNNESAIQIEFTKRRIDETQRVFASKNAQVTNSLTNLTNQVDDTEKSILEEKNPQKQQELAKTYILTLTDVNNSLQQEKEKKIESLDTANSVQENPIISEAAAQNQMQPTPTQTVKNEQLLVQKTYDSPSPTIYIKPTDANTSPVKNFISPTITPKKDIPTPTQTPTVTVVQNSVVTEISQTQKKVETVVQNLTDLSNKDHDKAKKEDENKKNTEEKKKNSKNNSNNHD